MALSSVTLAQLRSDLRLRLNEITEDNFSDEELNRWLNLAQYEVAIKLNGISAVWYGTFHVYLNVSIETTDNIFYSADISNLAMQKLVAIHSINTDNGEYNTVPIKTMQELLGYRANNYWSSTKPVCAIWGQKLYFNNNPTASSDWEVSVYYYAKPTEMASDGANMDVPTEFQDLVILVALQIAMRKLRIITGLESIEADIALKFNEIKQSVLEDNSGQLEPVTK